MNYKIIRTGSKGNAVLLNDCILIDCGVPYKMISEYAHQLRLVLLTHIHGDHFKSSTVRALAKERPALRWCCCAWMVDPLVKAGVDLRQIDVAEYTPEGGTSRALIYNGLAIVNPVPLVHDVQNCGWEIHHKHESAFYATDTGTLDGISAPNYDLYLVEANHKQAELEARLAAKEAAGAYAYERRAAVNHLSEEQTLAWLAENAGPHSLWVPLHKHEE